MRKSKANAAKKLAIGAGIAAAAGYVAGILTAPKSGKETRGSLKHAADKGMDEAEKQLKKLHVDIDSFVDQAKDRSDKLSSKAQKEFDKLLENAKDARDKVGELTHAVRKGKADDKDLKKAMKDATKAIEHLRDYLSK